MTTALALFTGVALAARIDAEEAGRAVDEVKPWLEAELGRSFVRTPSVSISNRTQLGEMLGRGMASSPELAEHHEMLVTSSLAVYVPSDQAVYLVKEAFEEAFRSPELASQDLYGMLRCVMAHELTHALQQQYSPPVTMAAGDPIPELALIEGQANAVARDYCRANQPQVADAFAAMAPRPPFDEGDRAELIYGSGVRVADRLVERGGWEAVWAALENTPDLAVLSDIGGLPPGWDDPRLLAAPAAAHLGSDGFEEQETVADLPHLLALLGEGPPLGEGALGHFYFASRGSRSLALFAVRSDAGPTVIQRRREAVVREQALFFGSPPHAPLPSHLRSMRWAARQLHLNASLRFAAGAYQEYWASTDEVLVSAFAQGVDLGVSGFRELLRQVLDRVPEASERVPGADAEAWLDETVAMALPDGARAPVAPEYRAELAAAALEAGDDLACGTQARLALAEQPPERHGAVAELFHACAVDARDLETADALVSQVGAVPSVLGHASLLMERERTREALALVQERRFEDEAVETDRVNLEMILLAQTGELDTAEAMALDGAGRPLGRYYVGATLASKGRLRSARRILDAACPELAPEMRGECEGLARQLR